MRTIVAVIIGLSVAITAHAVDTMPESRRRFSQFCEGGAIDVLNSRIKVLGADGWELAAITANPGGGYIACLKREMR